MKKKIVTSGSFGGNTEALSQALMSGAKESGCQVVTYALNGYLEGCSGCRYYVSHCPGTLDIPGLLRLYNEYQASEKWRLGRLKGAEASMQPFRCVGCHLCTKQCPQQIQVSDYMRKMAEDLNTL